MKFNENAKFKDGFPVYTHKKMRVVIFGSACIQGSVFPARIASLAFFELVTTLTTVINHN